MKKGAKTPLAPLPLFSVFKYDEFLQKYVAEGEIGSIFGTELYLNPPIMPQIRENLAKPDLVIAKSHNNIFTGLRKVGNVFFVGNIPNFKGVDKLSLVVASKEAGVFIVVAFFCVFTLNSLFFKKSTAF